MLLQLVATPDQLCNHVGIWVMANACFDPGRKLGIVGSILIRLKLRLAGWTTVDISQMVFFRILFRTFLRSPFLNGPIK